MKRSALIIIVLSQSITCHSYLATPLTGLRSPQPRNKFDKGNIVPVRNGKSCQFEEASSYTTYTRGQSVPYSWPRNNHPG